MKPNEISGAIVDAAYHLHTRLGPGLLESVYEELLAYERNVARHQTRIVILNEVKNPVERSRYAQRNLTGCFAMLSMTMTGSLGIKRLRRLGVNYERQKPVPVRYDDRILEIGFRTDLIVDAPRLREPIIPC